LKYRKLGDGIWHKGATVDISRSGVLFRAEFLVPLKTIVEMRIEFSQDMTCGPAAEVTCRGPVVRCEPDEQSGAGLRLAASFATYRFCHL
jgi:hypothetical protein